MRSTIVVFDQPGVEISLQLVDRVIDLLAERDPVKLVQDSAMEALADPVGLRALGLCAAVIDVLNCKIELVIVALAATEGQVRLLLDKRVGAAVTVAPVAGALRAVKSWSISSRIA